MTQHFQTTSTPYANKQTVDVSTKTTLYYFFIVWFYKKQFYFRRNDTAMLLFTADFDVRENEILYHVVSTLPHSHFRIGKTYCAVLS